MHPLAPVSNLTQADGFFKTLVKKFKGYEEQ